MVLGCKSTPTNTGNDSSRSTERTTLKKNGDAEKKDVPVGFKFWHETTGHSTFVRWGKFGAIVLTEKQMVTPLNAQAVLDARTEELYKQEIDKNADI